MTGSFAGAPAGFSGAVGEFDLDVRVDRVSTRAGEPLTVTTVLRGFGNLASASDPDVLTLGKTRRHAAPATTMFDRSGDRLRGERRHDITFVPEMPGELGILPVRFSWFDPEAARYRTQVSDTIRVRVSPGGGTADSLALARPSTPLATTRDRSGVRGRLDLDAPPAARALALSSLLASLGAFVAGRVRARSERDPRRRRLAAIDARLRELRAARASGSSRAAAVAAGALRETAAIRHGADIEGLPLPDATAALVRAGAGEPEIAELRALLESLDRVAFAPDSGAGASPDSAAAQALDAAETRIVRYPEEVAR